VVLGAASAIPSLSTTASANVLASANHTQFQRHPAGGSRGDRCATAAGCAEAERQPLHVAQQRKRPRGVYLRGRQNRARILWQQQSREPTV
jgi:hypothetical protein